MKTSYSTKSTFSIVKLSLAFFAVFFSAFLLQVNTQADDSEGVFFFGDAWYYVSGGEIQYGYTGVKPNEYGWWYIENGRVNFDYTGIASNEFGDWYINSGKVDFYANDIIFTNNHGDWGWWNIRGGAVDYSDTVAPNGAGWWYCRAGKVDFDYTGIRPNYWGWWRIVNGMVDFNCYSVEENEFGWWYIEGGRVRFDYNGTGTNVAGQWVITDGNVTFADNGLMYIPGDNAWYLVSGSRVETEYTGPASNEFGDWYLVNGRVAFETSGVYRMTVNGVSADWIVLNGNISGTIDDTEVARLAKERLDIIGWDIYAAYNWCVNLAYQKDQVGDTTSSNATYSFKTSIGDCAGRASAFYWMAKLLGYDVKAIMGQVPRMSGGWTAHAWVEYYENGTTYIIDPYYEWQTKKNGFKFEYGTPGTWVFINGNVMSDF